MATYSSAPVESIIKYKYTHSNNSGSTGQNFQDYLFTVGANESYTLINSVVLNHSTTTTANVAGFMDTYKTGLNSYTEVITDTYYEICEIASVYESSYAAVGIDNLGNIPSEFDTGTNEHRGFKYGSYKLEGNQSGSGTAYYVCKLTGGHTWYEGMKLYLLSYVNYGTPAANEFAEFHLWFKKTVYNG